MQSERLIQLISQTDKGTDKSPTYQQQHEQQAHW
jgi:hypothetical protein